MSQMSQAGQAEARWAMAAWDIELDAAQAAHIQRLAAQFLEAQGEKPDCNAYLALDHWADNPVAGWLEEHCPAFAAARVVVPHLRFHDDPDLAPCLLPLAVWQKETPEPEQWADRLHDLLGRMWIDAQRRLVPQWISGWLLSSAALSEVAEHWAALAWQFAPLPEGGWGEPATLRHHDPRILQRLWPLLTPAQLRAWLGPVDSIWQLAAPWGPWEPRDMFAHSARLCGANPAWHIAAPPDKPTTGSVSPSRLLDHRQWQRLAHNEAGHGFWHTLALRDVPPALQPNGTAMTNLLLEAQQWGLRRPVQLQEWVTYTWMGAGGQDPSEPIDWNQAPWSGRRSALQQAILRTPDASFFDLAFEIAPPPAPVPSAH